MLDPPWDIDKKELELEWSGKAFKKMKNLKILIIKHVRFSTAPTYLPNSLRLLDWESHPSSSFPCGFNPKKLAVLEVPRGHLTLEKPFQEFLHLTRMDFSYCHSITKVPDLSGVPNLAELLLDRCQNLVEVHDSVGSLGKLVILSAEHCWTLTSLPQGFRLKSLESLYLKGCSKLHRFPDIMEIMENVHEVDVSLTAIEELPSSIQNLLSLEFLCLDDCERFKFVPSTIALLQKLVELDFRRTLIRNYLWSDSSEGCSAISPRLHEFNVFNNITVLTLKECNLLDEHLSLIPRSFPSLKCLDLKGNHFERIPVYFRELQRLRELDLQGCTKLHEFPDIISCMPQLSSIFAGDCTALRPGSSKFILELGKRLPKPKPGIYHNRGLIITVPGTRVPDWAVHRSKGRHISFYARGAFPKIIFCIALQIDATRSEFWDWKVHLFVNRGSVKIEGVAICVIEGGNQVWLFDYRQLDSSDEGAALIRDNWDGANWNHVVVRYTLRRIIINDDKFFEGAKAKVRECGIHLREEENNMKDICFSCPPDCQETQQLVSDEEENPIILENFAVWSSSP